jgi:hypothetical protein
LFNRNPQVELYLEAATELIGYGDLDQAKDILVDGIEACTNEPVGREQLRDLIAVIDLQKRLGGFGEIEIRGFKITLDLQPLCRTSGLRWIQ